MKQIYNGKELSIIKTGKTKVSVAGKGINDIKFMYDGQIITMADSVAKRLYEIWRNVLVRTSPEHWAEYPWYADTMVCDEWLIASNFFEWMFNGQSKTIQEIIDGGLELDKDALSGEIKIYSPETCQFITKAENVQEAQNLPVIAINPFNLKDYTIYKSSMDAVRAIGANKGNITSCCQGHGRQKHKGLLWYQLTSDGLIKVPVHFYKPGTPVSERNQEYVYVQVWELTGEREEFFTRVMF